MLFQHIFFGLIAVAVGILTLKYNFQIVNNSFRLDWIESKLGSGSTFLVFKLISVVLVLGGILYATGLGNVALGWLLSPLTSLFPKPQ